MSKTPPHLRPFGIPEEIPDRKLNRGWQAFAPLQKDGTRSRDGLTEFLALAWGMQYAKAIEQTGDSTMWTRAVAQQTLAEIGMDRSTMNRLIAQFSAPDGRWDEPCMHNHHGHAAGTVSRRECWRERKKDQARKKGMKIHDRPRRCIQRKFEFVSKQQAGIGCALRYCLKMDQRLKPTMDPRVKATEDAEKLARAFGNEWFNPQLHVNGYQQIFGWIMHRNLPMAVRCSCRRGQMVLNFNSDCANCRGRGWTVPYDALTGKMRRMPKEGRVFLIRLIMAGILERCKSDCKVKHQHRHGYLEITQKALGEMLGWHRNTVAKWEDVWEDLKILQIVPGIVWRECCDERYQGKLCPKCGKKGPVVDRKPHRVIWLPDLLLDGDLVKMERERFLAMGEFAQRMLHGKPESERIAREKDLGRANELHVELIKEWTIPLQKHYLRALWNEMRRRYFAAGIHQSIIDALFPLSDE